jgi:hypothetical protein
VVPAVRSTRAGQVTSKSGSAPLAADVVPRPFAKSPSQTVVAWLSLAIVTLLLGNAEKYVSVL